MSGRIRHQLRKLWAAGLLKVGGRLPTWMTRVETLEEASPEDVRKVLDRPQGEVTPVLQPLPTGDSCVGKDRLTGRILISGGSCLEDKHWIILKRGTLEECIRYAREAS